jgi:uncharacterized protein
MSNEIIFYIILAGFAAGFLDAIVGGGGLIMTPAMMSLFPQFEILRIIATNRTSSILGTSTAAVSYFQNVKIRLPIILSAGIAALVTGSFGAYLASFINSSYLKIVVLIVIVCITIYTFVKKDLGQKENLRFSEAEMPKAAMLIGAVCGFYNGLIGPGTGTLLVFAFVSFVGMNFLKASAISKVTNVCGDIGSWTVLAWKGYIFWPAAIPLILSNMLGSYIGSRLAILKGSKFIKIVFFVVVSSLIIKTLYDLYRLW